jgi:hypothetical protein
MLTQVGAQFGLDANTAADLIQEDLPERNCGHMLVMKVRTDHTLFDLASNFVAVVELSHVQLSAPFNSFLSSSSSFISLNYNNDTMHAYKCDFSMVLSVYLCV